jgi:hypothetical protein
MTDGSAANDNKGTVNPKSNINKNVRLPILLLWYCGCRVNMPSYFGFSFQMTEVR